ncbi:MULTISPECIES: hypothetical protein [Cytobacillus]|uniref:Uncharacterized protein n=2 Tax=Cytobacillus TaxID=2675230 RepID=A0ABX3CZ80_9BACI|nr:MULTISPECIES: hypothetical protein [Cytobacillus]EFV76785.1 hypothetical protein HMPREF1013_02973 [Bacillus sp. 2_A_57_CT2]MBY0154975.1 hypothetical protein [Cytobacillus firmus]MBU8729585.1 hypothetical protein [Cytobacillus oceanisediminis]MCM3401265.1 hypothetical protein [Cytobacillus oceanisediminis]MCM3530364.1 hypothetical protein [Cytobacillus oceanisediminis]
MNPYEITSMIIDDEFDGEEYVTTEFLQENNTFSITFKKADLEVINAWVFNDGSSLPANLSEEMIESIRNSVKKRIGRK